MIEWFNVLGWGFVVRLGQTLIEASLTLLCGVFVAAVLRRMVGAETVRRVFGGKTWGSLVTAWAAGMLLPVCSFGVIPVAREMARAGVPRGTVLAFALAAPLLNPVSLLYGLTLSEPVVIFSFVAGTLVVSVIAGFLWDRVFEGGPAPAVPPSAIPPPGLKRLAAVVVTAARELTGPSLGYVLLGAVGAAVLTAALPHGYLQHTMSPREPWSPALMAAVATPAYSSPMKAMMQLGLMFDHGNSVGAAYALLVLGAGVNLGVLAWVGSWCGWRRALGWFAAVVAVTLALAYALELNPLNRVKPDEGHTHAFDEFTNPFPADDSHLAAQVASRLTESLDAHDLVALGGLALLFALAGVVALLDRRFAVDGYLDRAAPAGARRYDVNVPGPVLGAVAIAGVVAFSVLGLYIYYPPADELFEEMSRVRADLYGAVRGGHVREAERQIRRWDHLTRKLEVGIYLRHGTLDTAAREQSEELRERLEELRDAYKEGEADRAPTELMPAVFKAYERCRELYRPYRAAGG